MLFAEKNIDKTTNIFFLEQQIHFRNTLPTNNNYIWDIPIHKT